MTVALIVLDGWGVGKNDQSNPIYNAHLTTIPSLKSRYPLTYLEASGISVGLPWGEPGSSEVGHMTMGAGRIVYQHYPRISLAVRDGSFFENEALRGACAHVRQHHSALHVVGLLTKNNTHASLEHLKALLDLARREQIDAVWLHLFTDGRDSPPGTVFELLAEVPRERIADLTGRSYAMDRDNKWELVEIAYAGLTAEASPAARLEQEINETISRYGSEEFLRPITAAANAKIKDNDAVIFFNFREDGIRELSETFTNPAFDKFPVRKFSNLAIVTMTRYTAKFNVPVAFPDEAITNSLGEMVSNAGRTQLRLAETYKYAHVTYFFNGYRETPFPNEFRVLIPSLAASDIENHPEMMAPTLTDRLLQSIESRAFDFILVNYANPDTLAHTGNFNAGVAAAQVIDREIAKITRAMGPDAVAIITSDHGNLERMVNPLTGRIETQHDPSPVPFYLVGRQFEHRLFAGYEHPDGGSLGTLADIAPTILEIMGIPAPREMTGQSLLHHLSQNPFQ